jgi:hypothetical protein
MKSARVIFPLVGLLGMAAISRADDPPAPPGTMKVDLVFQGGHDTDPRDHGRPVVLVAAALGVPPDVFREAFSHVHPAPAGEQPKPADVRQNKHELLSRLAPYGVTNDRLDEVSNYYRYRRESGRLWRHDDAAGYALVQGGKIISITITNPGAGYTTPPKVSVPGVALTDYPVAVVVSSIDLARNGSIAKIDLRPVEDLSGPEPGSVHREEIKNVLENPQARPPAPSPH